MAVQTSNKELDKDILEYLQSIQPDVFLYVDGVGYVQAWKCENVFWLECKGAYGEYFGQYFSNTLDMLGICESYFNALRCGYLLWEV